MIINSPLTSSARTRANVSNSAAVMVALYGSWSIHVWPAAKLSLIHPCPWLVHPSYNLHPVAGEMLLLYDFQLKGRLICAF